MGNTVECDKKGWCAVTVNGYPIGWGKASNGILKIIFPKYLRLKDRRKIMNLFESERKVMDVLWREGSITAGEIAKYFLILILAETETLTYTVINKCIKRVISRGEDNLFAPVITKDEVKTMN